MDLSTNIACIAANRIHIQPHRPAGLRNVSPHQRWRRSGRRRRRCGNRHHNVGHVGAVVAHVDNGAHHADGGAAQGQMEADLAVRAGRREVPAAAAARGQREVHGSGALHQQRVADRSNGARWFSDVIWHSEHPVLAGVCDVPGGLSGSRVDCMWHISAHNVS